MFETKKDFMSNAAAIIFVIMSLTACGGSGSGSNTAPTANAGADQKGKLNSIIILDGSGSSDADGNSLTYTWTLTNKPAGSTATLSDADTDTPTLIPDVGGIYEASLIVSDGSANSNPDSVTIISGALFPEYDPLGIFTSCTTTYDWTVGPNTGNQFSSTSAGLETVNYTSGSLTGTIINGSRDLISLTTYNDGTSFRILRLEGGGDNVYLSTDCAMSSHPEGYSFDIVYDGMLLDQVTNFVDVNNPSSCTGPDTQKALFTLQDITIQGTTYQDAILWWTLDLNFPFQAVSHAKFTSLGIISPSSIQTGGASPTDVEIYVNGIGSVAGGDIGAATGTLNDFAERTSGSCN